MTSPTLGANVIERINHARRIIAETDFQKSGKVQGGQSYNFIPIGQILAAVRKAHAIAGVTVVYGRPEYDTEQYEKRYSYVKKGQYGESTWQAANGHIHVTIYGSSVEDYIELEVPFEAQDNSDKLTNKIVTNAERCLYRELYCIDEGDATDPEAYNYEIPAQEPEKPKRKRAAPSEDDPFFGKKSPKANIQPVRDAVMEFWKRYPLNQTVHSFTKLAGPMETWDDKTFENCYRQLSSEGAADLKKVVL